MKYKVLLPIIAFLFIIPVVGFAGPTLVERQEICRDLCPDIMNASCVKEKCGVILNPDPRGASTCDSGNKCPSGYICSTDYSMYSNYAYMTGVNSNELAVKGVCISTTVKYTTPRGCPDVKCPSGDMCVVARGSVLTSGLCVRAGGSGGKTCGENEELKSGSCECKQNYYSAGGKCVSKDEARKICKGREHTVFDEKGAYCICGEGYDMSFETKKCEKVAPSAECKAAEDSIIKVRETIENVRTEITKTNNISVKRMKNREKAFPPGAWTARFQRYEGVRKNLETDLEEIKNTKLKLAEENMSSDECGIAKGLADAAQAELDKTNYAKFRAESCAMQATPVITKAGAYRISASLKMPEGCDPKLVRLTVKKRTRSWSGLIPVETTTSLTTNNGEELIVPRIEHQDEEGAVGSIKVDQLLNELGAGGYNTRSFIWSSTWIYGEVSSNPNL